MPDPQPTRLQGAPEDPEARHWRDYARSSHTETPRRLEEAAKFLTGVIALSLTLTLDNPFFEKAAASPPAPPAGAWSQTLVGAALALWVLALAAALWVVFPLPYRYAAQSSESIRQAHERAVRRKYLFLVLAAAGYVLAIGAMAWVRW